MTADKYPSDDDDLAAREWADITDNTHAPGDDGQGRGWGFIGIAVAAVLFWVAVVWWLG